MKKKWLTAVLSAILTLGAVGCSINDNSNEWKQATFTVGYDYGTHEAGKVTMLLNGSLPFFDYNKNYAEGRYDYLVAGDEITVYYSGEMYTQEIYPSVVTVSGEIKKVEKTNRAQLIENCYKQGENVRCQPGEWGFIELPTYVINQDGSFTAFSTLEDGASLYVTFVIPNTPGVDYDIDQSRIRPSALYSYNPKNDEKKSVQKD